MSDIERTYNIPLRSSWLKAPMYRRSKKAVNTIKLFLVKHMKCKKINLGQKLNEFVWKHGIKNPPARVKVNVRKTKKDDEDIVYAELYGEKLSFPEKPKEKKGLAEKLGFKEETAEQKSETIKEEKVEVKVDAKKERLNEEKKKAKYAKEESEEKEKEKMLEKAEKEKDQHEAEGKSHTPEKDSSYTKTPAKNKQFKEQYDFHR